MRTEQEASRQWRQEAPGPIHRTRDGISSNSTGAENTSDKEMPDSPSLAGDVAFIASSFKSFQVYCIYCLVSLT